MRNAKVSAKAYRSRVFSLLHGTIQGRSFDQVLDFGAGDGWFAHMMNEAGLARSVVAVEVMRRQGTHHPVQVYDGRSLPFANGEFPLVYTVDVIHHCPDPLASLREALRVCGQYFLIKDHTYKTKLGKLTLAAFDEIGNRRFGVPCLYHHQEKFSWSPQIEAEGFSLVEMICPANLHRGLIGTILNPMEYVALWSRK